MEKALKMLKNREEEWEEKGPGEGHVGQRS